MIYWISINTYLWKNIFNRWLESPLGPLSKVILTFLLSFLSLVVIGVLRNTENLLEEQFSQKEVLTSVVSINRSPFNESSEKLSKSLYQEAFLNKANPECEINYFRRPGVMAKDTNGQMIPIVVCFKKPSFWRDEWEEFERPEVYLFKNVFRNDSEELQIKEQSVEAILLPMPEVMKSVTKGKGVLVVPYPMGRLLLEPGFSEILVLRSKNFEAMEATHHKLEAYFTAQGESYSLFSALSLLAQLESFSELQGYVRWGLALLIILITAIVLGNQALLEFREQQYQFALLRSFGSPLYLIMSAELLEKLLLAAIGVYLAQLVITPVSDLIGAMGETLSIIQLDVHRADLALISTGVMSGVAVSWAFLVFIARKPIGLVLS